MRSFKYSLSATLLGLGLTTAAAAETYYYTGTLTFVELNGTGCGGAKAGDTRNLRLAVHVDGASISGYSEMQGGDASEFAGDAADRLLLKRADPRVAAERLSLQGIGSRSVKGETEATALPPGTAGCILTRSTLSAEQTATGVTAETNLRGVALTFQSARAEYIARGRDPAAYQQMKDLATEVAKAEIKGGPGWQEAVKLRAQLQAIYEKLYDADSAQSLNSLLARAKLHTQLEQTNEALALLQRALDIAEKNFTARVNAIALDLGNLLEREDKKDLALAAFTKALVAEEKQFGREHIRVANVLVRQVKMLEALQLTSATITAYQRILAIREKTPNPQAAAIEEARDHLIRVQAPPPAPKVLAWIQQLNQATAAGNLALSVSLRQQIIAAESAAKPSRRVADLLLNQARDLDTLKRNSEALTLYPRVLAAFDAAYGPQHETTQRAVTDIADGFSRNERYSDALRLYERNVAFQQKTKGAIDAETAHSLTRLGRLHMAVGQVDKAFNYYQQALVIHERNLGAEHIGLAMPLQAVSTAHAAMGNHAKALPLRQRALGIAELAYGFDDARIVPAINHLAGVREALGQYDVLLPLYQRALQITETERGASHPDTAPCLAKLADLYRRLGQAATALPLAERSQAIYAASGADTIEAAAALTGLAQIFTALESADKAGPLLKQALRLREKLQGAHHADTATSLADLAQYHRQQRDVQAALPLLERALAIREKNAGTFHAATANSMIDLAQLYVEAGQPARARPLLQRAYHVGAVTEAAATNELAARHLAQFYLSQNNPAAAIYHLKRAVNLLHASAANATSSIAQQSVTTSNDSAYNTLAALLIQASRLTEAERVLAMKKEREYFSYIGFDTAADPRRRRLPFDMNATEKSFSDQLATLTKTGVGLAAQLKRLNTQAKLGMSPAEEQQRTTLSSQLAREGSQTTALLNALAAQLPTKQQPLPQTLAAADSMQQQVAELGSQVNLIQYLLHDNKLHIIVTNWKSQLVRTRPVDEAALKSKLLAFRQALEDPREDPRPVGETLYRTLFEPIVGDIKDGQTVMLALDGALRYIPFAALFDGKRYLVERFNLSLYTAAAKHQLAPNLNLPWKMAGFGVAAAHGNFAALPGVREELAGIVAIGGLGGETTMDNGVSANQLQGNLRKGYPVLHFASHVGIAAGTDADAFWLLGDGQRLSLKDIRLGSYPFEQLDLLTLSFATTSRGGQQASGREVEGVSTLAQNKGAKAVLATLWSVADTNGADLLPHFYRSVQQHRMTKTAALREAQLSLLNSTETVGNNRQRVASGGERADRNVSLGAPETGVKAPFAHPYYWAAYVLTGNWL